MTCKQCGREIPDNGTFCGFCGTSVTANNQSYSHKQKTSVSRQTTQTNMDNNQRKPKEKKNFLWFWIALSVVGLAVVGAVAWFLLLPDSSVKPAQVEEPLVTVWMMTEQYDYNRNGTIASYQLYKWDAQGNLLEKENQDRTGPSTNNKTTYTYIYTYDGAGNEISSTTLKDGEDQGHTECVYDENRNLIEYIYYDGAGNETSSTKYIYDKEGNQIGNTNYNAAGNQTSSTEMGYDGNGNLILYIGYDRAGNEEFRVSYVYNSAGNKIEEVSYSHGVEEDRNIWTYDEKGNLVQMMHYIDGEKRQHEVNTYDDNSNLLESNITYRWPNPDGSDSFVSATERNTYTYDNAGKLIESVEYQNDTEHDRRTYTYDASGKLLEENSWSNYSEYSGNWRTVYSYDEYGNVISIDSYWDNEKTSYKTRSWISIKVTKERAVELQEKGYIVRAED